MTAACVIVVMVQDATFSYQESLANAMVSARQQCLWKLPAKKYTADKRKEYNTESTFSGLITTVSLTIRVYLYSFSCCNCCLPNLRISRNFAKIQTYSSKSSKVIDLGANRKHICNFVLVINSNFGRISYHFRDIDAFSSKIACFVHYTLVWRPLAEERPASLT